MFVRTLSLLLLFFSLSACASAWHGAKDFYNTFIDPPVKYKMDDGSDLSNTEELLATNLMKVGEELRAFENVLAVLELPPTSTAIDELFLTFPWVDGIALINADGFVTGALPAAYPNYLDFTSLLLYPEWQDKRATRVISQISYDTHTTLVGIPVYDNVGALLGVFIVYFNTEKFFEYMELSPYVFVMAGNDPVWFGSHEIENTPLANVDFEDKVTSKAHGKVSNSFGKAEWINYYFYSYPFIFAVMQE